MPSEECLKYKTQILDILESTNLETVTAKSIRRALESNNQVSLDHIKSEMNDFIMELYVAAESKQSKVVVAQPVKPKKETKAKDTKKIVKKKTVKKVVEEKEKKPRNWPVVRIMPPLSTIIGTDICSRPQIVKKIWEYIRKNNLQDPSDKRIIICDANFKAFCDGEEKISGFTMNKHIQKYVEKVPEYEQAELKQKFMEQMLAESGGVQV